MSFPAATEWIVFKRYGFYDVRLSIYSYSKPDPYPRKLVIFQVVNAKEMNPEPSMGIKSRIQFELK